MRPCTILAAAMILSISTAAPADAQLRRAFAGVSAGASSSQLSASSNSDFRWGAMVGAFGAFRPTGGTITTVEANWVQKGGGNTRLEYIEIPLTVGVDGPLGDSGMRGRIYSGVGFGFRVACSTDAVTLNCDNANSTEWTWPLGLQLGRRTDDGRLVAFDVRYSIGLSRVFSNRAPENRAWQFRLSYGLPIMR